MTIWELLRLTAHQGIDPNQDVRVKLDGHPDVPMRGIAAIGPEIDSDSGEEVIAITLDLAQPPAGA